jgi:hypothetical protein
MNKQLREIMMTSKNKKEKIEMAKYLGRLQAQNLILEIESNRSNQFFKGVRL